MLIDTYWGKTRSINEIETTIENSRDSKYSTIHRWNLNTKDAHDLYRHYGFSELASPEVFMEKIFVNWT